MQSTGFYSIKCGSLITETVLVLCGLVSYATIQRRLTGSMMLYAVEELRNSPSLKKCGQDTSLLLKVGMLPGQHLWLTTEY